MLIDITEKEKITIRFLMKPFSFFKRIKVGFSYIFGRTSKTHFRMVELNKEAVIATRHLFDEWLGDSESTIEE